MPVGTPYTAGPKLIQSDGTKVCVALGAPPRGKITALKIEQISGTDQAATLDVFSKDLACPAGSSSESGDTEFPRRMYKVMPTKAITSGVPVEDFNLSYTYENQDGGQSNRRSKLYLELDPGGAGDSEWVVTMEIEGGGPQ